MPAAPPAPKEIREQGKALYLQGLQPKQIATVLNLSPVTVRKWVSRDGWAKLLTKTQEIAVTPKQATVTRSLTLIQPVTRMPHGAPSRLREELSAEVGSQMAVLRSEPVKKASELANTREREGRASIVKRLVDSAAILEDWESQRTPGIVMMAESMVPADEARSIATSAQVEMLPDDPASEAIRALQED